MLGVEVKVFLINPNKPVVVVFEVACLIDALLALALALAGSGLLVEVVEVAIADGLIEEGPVAGLVETTGLVLLLRLKDLFIADAAETVVVAVDVVVCLLDDGPDKADAEAEVEVDDIRRCCFFFFSSSFCNALLASISYIEIIYESI